MRQPINYFDFFKIVLPLEYEFNRIYTEYSFALNSSNKAAVDKQSAYDAVHGTETFQESRAIIRDIETKKAEGGLTNDAEVVEYLANAILSGKIEYDPDFVTKISAKVPPARAGRKLDMWDVIYYLTRL